MSHPRCHGPCCPVVGTLLTGLRCLTVVAVLGVAAVAAAQQATNPPAAPTTPTPGTLSPEAAAALALDKKLIAEAKQGSEIMTNLGYLSDVIGPRLTGSPALKRANEWTAEKMKSYGLSNV